MNNSNFYEESIINTLVKMKKDFDNGKENEFREYLVNAIHVHKLNASNVLKMLNITSSTYYYWKSRVDKGIKLFSSVGNPELIDEIGTIQLKNELDRLGTMQRGIILYDI